LTEIREHLEKKLEAMKAKLAESEGKRRELMEEFTASEKEAQDCD